MRLQMQRFNLATEYLSGAVMMRLVSVLVVAGISGCSSLKNNVVMPNVSAPQAEYVLDHTTSDDYPSYMVAEGNIYSCRYGIHHQSLAEFSPSKVAIFGSILRQQLPSAAQHRVVLTRFDVYHNQQLKLLRMTGSALGGVFEIYFTERASVNDGVFSSEKFQVERNPGSSSTSAEKIVGCDQAFEGEYDASQISAFHDVVVTWLVFSVDSVDYKLRTFYQFLPASKPDIAIGIEDAIRMSIQAAAMLVDADISKSSNHTVGSSGPKEKAPVFSKR